LTIATIIPTSTQTTIAPWTQSHVGDIDQILPAPRCGSAD
jgi:hypothetical protein